MATQAQTIDFLLDQLASLKTVSARKMFGEYALYYQDKVVGLVTNDQLFIKPSSADAPFQSTCSKVSPYPGAKEYWLISEETWEDKEWLTDFIAQTAEALPLPKPKKKKV